MTEETIFGKYVLKEQLGRGGFGTIYRAEDSTLHVERALKILHPQYNADPTFIERFRQEARTAARLEHPNIVPVIELGQHEGAFYLVMSLMPGGSVKDVLQNNGPLPLERALDLLEQVARGLDFAYNLPEKLIHRDIKPANILIDRNGSARVSDFGFAKALESSASMSLSASGGLIGTPTYMAPELWRGQPASRASDIYSLTAMFYEFVTGQMLFTGNSPAEVMTRHVMDGPKFDDSWPDNVPAALRPVLERGLSKDPEERFNNAYAFYQAAAQAASPQPEATPPAGLKTAAPQEEADAAAPPIQQPAPEPPAVASPAQQRQDTTSTSLSQPVQPPQAPISQSASPPEQPRPAATPTPMAQPAQQRQAPSSQSAAQPVHQTPAARPGSAAPPERNTSVPPRERPAENADGLIDRLIALLPGRKAKGGAAGDKKVSRRTVFIAGCLGIVIGVGCAIYGLIALITPDITDILEMTPLPTETSAIEIEDTPQAEVVISPTPSEEPLPAAPRTLVICMGREPESLYLYEDESFTAQQVREAIFDGPIDSPSYRYEPVILEKLPNLADGDAVFQPVNVTRGDTIVDAYGDLVTLDDGIEYVPSGCLGRTDCSEVYAGSRAVSIDQMVVAFSLLPGLTWSDGAPLTAGDSVFSFMIASAEATPNGKYIESRTQAYEAVDDTTVVWTGIPGFRDTTYVKNFWSPLPEHLLASMTAEALVDAPETNTKPLGWGPYVLDEWSPGDSIRLNKNENYFRAEDGLPKFDHLVFRFIGTDFNTVTKALISGECDILDQTTQLADIADLIALENNDSLRAVFGESNLLEHLDFGLQPACFDNGGWQNCLNQGRPDYFGDVRVRLAIAYCIDRREIADSLFLGRTEVPASYLPSSHPLFSPGVPTYTYDPELASALMDEAGLAPGSDGVRVFGDGTRLSFNYITTDDYSFRIQTAEYLAAMLAECGIELNVQVFDSETVFNQIFAREFDLSQFAWRASPLYTQCSIWMTDVSGSINSTGYSNEEFDLLCQIAEDLLPGESGFEDYNYAAQDVFMQDLPIIPLFMHPNLAATRPDMCNFYLDPSTGSDTWNIEDYDIDPVCSGN